MQKSLSKQFVQSEELNILSHNITILLKYNVREFHVMHFDASLAYLTVIFTFRTLSAPFVWRGTGGYAPPSRQSSVSGSYVGWHFSCAEIQGTTLSQSSLIFMATDAYVWKAVIFCGGSLFSNASAAVTVRNSTRNFYHMFGGESYLKMDVQNLEVNVEPKTCYFRLNREYLGKETSY